MQAEITFRPLVADDYESVIAFWRRCEGVEIAEGDDAASFCGYLERNPGLSFCAVAEGSIVGAALCGHDGRRGLIYHLAVGPGYRGRGIAKWILEAGLAGLRQRGISRAIILVANSNSKGRAFWAARGFETIDGALPMGLDLF